MDFESWWLKQPLNLFDGVTAANVKAAWHAGVAAERERCKARTVEIVGWHRNDYNGTQIDPLLRALREAL